MTASACVGCITFVGLLAFIIGMSISYSILSPLEAGVKMNTLSQSIDDKFFSQGRHYIGPLHKFIRYPTTLQTIEFGKGADANAPILRVQSKGGQTMQLEVSFQYRLMTSKLAQLYKSYELKYQGKFLSIAEAAIKNQGTKYSPTEYFTNRMQISEAIHTVLNLRFRDEFFAVVEHFQLRNVEPPKSISKNIRDKLIQRERGLLAIEEKKAVEVRAKSETIKSEYTRNQTIVNVEADYQASLLTEKANADAIAVVLTAKAQAYKNLKTNLGFTNSHFLNFLYIENIRTSKSPDKIVSNLDSALFTQSL